jgi:hypothetical protein
MSFTLLAYPSVSPHRYKRLAVVPECGPAAHHLRLAASAKDPTNPERTSLPQETLGLRRRGFSPLFSLLMPAFSLGIPPWVLTIPLRRLTQRSPTNQQTLIPQLRQQT